MKPEPFHLALRAGRRLQQRLQRAVRIARSATAIGSPARRVAGAVPAIERVMRRVSAPSIRHFTAHVRLQPVLSHHTLWRTERLDVRPWRAAAVPTLVLRRHDHTQLTHHVLQQRLLERLSPPRAPATTTQVSLVTQMAQRQAAPRLPMTMVRSQAAPAPAASAARSEAEAPPATSRPGRPSTPRAPSPAAPLVLPAQELSRLTEHVIRQLDHRVLSWQERTGRI